MNDIAELLQELVRLLKEAGLFLLLVLVCYRLARLITKEDGPVEIFKRPRSFIFSRANGKSPRSLWGQLADLIGCPYCLGMWIALALTMAFHPEQWVLYWLALAGGQAYLQGRG